MMGTINRVWDEKKAGLCIILSIPQFTFSCNSLIHDPALRSSRQKKKRIDMTLHLTSSKIKRTFTLNVKRGDVLKNACQDHTTHFLGFFWSVKVFFASYCRGNSFVRHEMTHWAQNHNDVQLLYFHIIFFLNLPQ